MTDRSRDGLRSPVLWAQTGWALLAMAWNLAGTALIARGLRPPGPTASYAAAALLAVLAVLLWWSRPYRRLLYIALSAGCGVLAALAVYQALTADPALWPSEFWRYTRGLRSTAPARWRRCWRLRGRSAARTGPCRWAGSRLRQPKPWETEQ